MKACCSNVNVHVSKSIDGRRSPIDWPPDLLSQVVCLYRARERAGWVYGPLENGSGLRLYYFTLFPLTSPLLVLLATIDVMRIVPESTDSRVRFLSTATQISGLFIIDYLWLLPTLVGCLWAGGAYLNVLVDVRRLFAVTSDTLFFIRNFCNNSKSKGV